MRKKNRTSLMMMYSLTLGVAIAGCSPADQPVESVQPSEKTAETTVNDSDSQKILAQVELAACSEESIKKTTLPNPSVKKWRPLEAGQPLSGIAAISVDPIFDGAGYGWKPGTSYAITKDGSVWRWGYVDGPVDFPVQIKGLRGVKQISDSFALTNDGQVWKLNSQGAAEKIKELENSESIQVVDMFEALIVLKKDGTLWKHDINTEKPEQLIGFVNIQKLYGSASSLFLVDSTGKLSYVDGSGGGQLTAENQQIIPVPGKVTLIAVDYRDHGLIQVDSGEVFVFSSKEKAPQRMPVADGAKRLAVTADDMYLMVKTDGSVWGWGANMNSMLGDEGPTTIDQPVQIQGLTRIIDIQAGTDHAIALDKGGHVYSWGSNMTGQLGRVPVLFGQWTEIGQLPDIQQVVTKLDKPFFVRLDGSIWSMYENRTTYEVKGPAQIRKLDSMDGTPVTINKAGQLQMWENDFTGCQTLPLPFSVKDMVGGDSHLLVRTEDDRYIAIAFDYDNARSYDRKMVPGKAELVEIDSSLASRITNLYANQYTFLALTQEGEVLYADRTKEDAFRFKKVPDLRNIKGLAPEYFVRYTHDPASIWVRDDKGRVEELLLQPEFEHTQKINSIRVEKSANVEEGIDKMSGRLRLTTDGQIFEHEWGPSVKSKIPEPVRLVSSTYRYAIEGPGSHYHMLVTENDKLIVIGYNPFGQKSGHPDQVISLGDRK
ncbi:hypothetical protein BRE01_54920 [Brevibacillus reuszeri]|uniref:Uncharacterized protein n=1 Tax=Brevibacillus reuszeri TaxID=54915 RepID=A0A0K9YNU1_9BACL|nr:hypothetical protein [Brevibacillus reuszeri]KNB70393.1 hypothetical protein ADS79_15725 [Brevibacillus reuszeri]MED1857923.1 regulator [Brevibacillus reuszeri]GED71790.1 hypothetical protein BRE01_54920 [Brevibacillus reuszeri]